MTITINPRTDTEIPEPLLQRWRRVPVAVIVDLDPKIRQIDNMIRPLRPSGSQPPLFGRAVTAQCAPPDFGGVLFAMDLLEAGDVLVIAAGSQPDHAMIGDVLGGLARAKGVVGVVCDGAVRDVSSLACWDDFSVYSRFITPRGPTAKAVGEINAAVSVGNAKVLPGDWIIGDDDGLVALSEADMTRWIEAAEARLVTEADWSSRLKSGETVNSVFSLDADAG